MDTSMLKHFKLVQGQIFPSTDASAFAGSGTKSQR